MPLPILRPAAGSSGKFPRMNVSAKPRPGTEFLDPDEHSPPLGQKVLMLNPAGVCVIGIWQEGMRAWCPLPKVPLSVKEKMNVE